MHPFAPQSLWGAEGCLRLFTGTSSPPDLKAWKSLATLPSQLSGFTHPPPPFPGKEVTTLSNHLEYLSPIPDKKLHTEMPVPWDPDGRSPVPS